MGLFGLEVAFVHPDAVHGVLTEVVSQWLTNVFVRIEIGFDGGQIAQLLVTPASADALERALAARRARRSEARGARTGTSCSCSRACST